MNEEDLLRSMYGGSPYRSKEREVEIDSEKSISRVIGGLKAQKSTSKIFEVDGIEIEVPTHEYVKLLELQVKELREKEAKQNVTIQRLQENTNSLSMRLRLIEDEFRKIPKFRS